MAPRNDLRAFPLSVDVLRRIGELNRPRDSQPVTEKVLDSPANPPSFSDFPEDEGDPKTAEKDPDNPEKPDPVRSGKQRPRNS
jgi:hypothetical protein